MRLAFLTHEPFYPPSGGGSAEAVYLVPELVRRGHEVQVFCPGFPDTDAAKGEFGVDLHPFASWQMGRYTSLRSFKYLAYPFFLQRMVERAARGIRFALILSQHAISAAAAGRPRQSMRVPVVMNFLDYLTGFMETWPPYLAPRAFIKALERFELSMPTRYQADGVMTVSDVPADYFANAGYPREGIQPIYYGYDAKLFPLSGSEGSNGRQPVVVMHGSFDHHHLGSIALEAIACVVRSRPEVKFKFVGKQTPALTKFRQRAATVVPGLQIECPGFVPYAEIARHLAGASLGIGPSEESTGTPAGLVAKIIEYLRLG